MGSTEIQIARISARVTQLTGHLQTHRKDYATTRGLVILLGQRRRLLTYLYKHNRYVCVTFFLHIFQHVKIQASLPLKKKNVEGHIQRLSEAGAA